jgi:hypothetical protein
MQMRILTVHIAKFFAKKCIGQKRRSALPSSRVDSHNTSLIDIRISKP